MMTNSEKDTGLNRRDVIVAAGALASVAVLAPKSGSADSAGHDMGPKNTALVEAALHCVKSSEVCVQHCIMMFRMDDISMRDCIAATLEMQPVCETLAKLAALDSAHLKAYAKVCIDVCGSCEKECRKHADKYKACKDCADSCAACIKACKAIAA
ncbi:MAG: four-helix bundle copper-binding protein [Alphaproteobacteria bacterium]|nr:four-helix bundle copper-binding protein [Alphaproteobacteria bacterium]MBF0128735.1 four-helix bundle copper-binding protein [Alphaproteobacteria bacterium]